MSPPNVWHQALDLLDPPPVEPHPALASLPAFWREAWPLVEPTTDLAWNWHHDVVCDFLVRVRNGEAKRGVINIPPGTSKSLGVSVFFPCWWAAEEPWLRVLTVSYSDVNTIRDNRRARDVMSSAWYQGLSDLRLASDQSGKIRFDTQQKGFRIASSVGGMATGEHPDLIIIDDPLKADAARSPAELRACREWYDRTISTRLARDPAILLIMQRLHREDLAAHVLGKGGWEHLVLDMRRSDEPYECPCHEGADPRDPRAEGELLWPKVWPEAKVRQEEIDLGPFGTAGQLQQRPVPEGGGYYKREWFEFVDAVPSGRKIHPVLCRGWDTAATEDAGDWTVGVKLARVSSTWYVEDVARARVTPAGVDTLIRQRAEADGRACSIREEREPGSSGKTVIAARARALAGFDYAGVSITGDKVTRQNPFRAQCEAGNVKIVRGPWNNAYLDVLCSFPVGATDDDVDASSCAFNAMASRLTSATFGR